MLIDDNCRLHCANLDLTSFSREKSQDKWPAYSLNMNQIEYVLDNLGRPVADRLALLQECVWLGGVVDFKSNCSHVGLRPTGRVPSVTGLPKGS